CRCNTIVASPSLGWKCRNCNCKCSARQAFSAPPRTTTELGLVCLVQKLDHVADLGFELVALDAAVKLHHAARVGRDDGLGARGGNLVHLVIENARGHLALGEHVQAGTAAAQVGV